MSMCGGTDQSRCILLQDALSTVSELCGVKQVRHHNGKEKRCPTRNEKAYFRLYRAVASGEGR